MSETNTNAGKPNKAIKKIKNKRGYRKQQSSTSILFLLWSVFTALSLLIVLLFTLSQRIVTTRAYKNEAANELRVKGAQIQAEVLTELDENGTNTPSAYLQRLSTVYDVHVFVLSPSGEAVFQPPLDVEEDAPPPALNFAEKIVRLQEELAAQDKDFALYEGEGEYVYGSEITLYEEEYYLYVSKSLGLTTAVSDEMGLRTLIIAVLTFILSFAVSGAVSNWLTKPLVEMKRKAARLAKGDFTVDFKGSNYGQEMVELAETLNYARDEISRADDVQKELIANVSHDFKTPLTMIKAYASMILEISGENREKREKHARVIVDEADRLTSLVNDVLAISKMRSGMDELQWTRFDMSAYLHDVLGKFDFLRETKGYVFNVDVRDGLYAYGDETKLGQVLYNLIGNAVNYTGEDKTVYVRLQPSGETTFRFSVTDTGAGIAEEELATIWDRYYRSKETHKRPVNGTGLGLSIVKTVLEKHGFVFGVKSEKDKGSTFYVEFPWEKSEKAKTYVKPLDKA